HVQSEAGKPSAHGGEVRVRRDAGELENVVLKAERNDLGAARQGGRHIQEQIRVWLGAPESLVRDAALERQLERRLLGPGHRSPSSVSAISFAVAEVTANGNGRTRLTSPSSSAPAESESSSQTCPRWHRLT